MFMGHVDGLPKHSSTKDLLLSNPVAELDGDEEANTANQILYVASFEELGEKYVLYDTIIWVLISLLLVLAWGVGVIMLLYLPIRRYVIQKDISSRKLYVTSHEIVYKVSRPSFIPFWGVVKFQKNVPLSLVIDVIVEQGWLQSLFGIHTIRVESIAHGKAAPVDELQIHGAYNPDLLRKVIVAEASKAIQNVGRGLRSTFQINEGGDFPRMESLTEGSTVLRTPSKNWKVIGSPSLEHKVGFSPDILLHKLDEVNKSVKKIESLVEKSEASPRSSAKRSLISAFGD